MNRVLSWTDRDSKKYKQYIHNNPRIENKNVMQNLMILDKQIQDLVDTHGHVKGIRESQNGFANMVTFLNDNFQDKVKVELPLYKTQGPVNVRTKSNALSGDLSSSQKFMTNSKSTQRVPGLGVSKSTVAFPALSEGKGKRG